MSFSQFIKISKLFGNYRKNSFNITENSFSSYHKPSKISIFRPKTTKDKKLYNNGFSKKNIKLSIYNKKSFESDLKSKKSMNDYNLIYENIIHLLNNLVNDNKENEKQLCIILETIYNFIDSIDINSTLQSENFSTLNTNKSNKRITKSNTYNTSKKFRLKNREMQKNEYDYLLYINELHKKLFTLEHELNIKSAKKNTVKENLKLLFKLDSSKFYTLDQLKMSNTSFSINVEKNSLSLNKLLDKDKRNKNLKISLKDIFNNIEKNEKENVKFYNNKKYLLSHPRLNFNGYINNNNGRLSSIVNEKINRIPKEAFGVNLHTKLQLNCKSHLQLTFNPIKFRYEKLIENKNKKIKTTKTSKF